MNKVGCDIDGCLASFLEAAHVIAYREHGIDLLSHTDEWWPADESVRTLFTTYCNDPDFYRGLVPVSGAVEGAQWLKKHFSKMYYVTHRPRSARVNTLWWLKRFGFPDAELVMPRGAKIVTAKRLGLRYFIDDRVSTIQDMRGAGIQAHLFVWSYRPTRAKSRLFANASTDWPELIQKLQEDLEHGNSK